MKYKENDIKKHLAIYVFTAILDMVLPTVMVLLRDAKKILNKEKALNYTYNSIKPRERKYSIRCIQ